MVFFQALESWILASSPASAMETLESHECFTNMEHDLEISKTTNLLYYLNMAL